MNKPGSSLTATVKINGTEYYYDVAGKANLPPRDHLLIGEADTYYLLGWKKKAGEKLYFFRHKDREIKTKN